MSHNIALPKEGYVRLKQVLAVIPVSRSTLYHWIKECRFPAPDKRFGARISVWDVKTVRQFLDKGVA